MTSELISQIDSLLALDANGCLVPHGIGGLARELLERCQVELNTRATPSADPLAGLQRYDLDFHGLHGEDAYMRKDETGEYVLHSEAAKIIAEQAAEIERMKSDRLYVVGCNDGYKTAEAELAQIKAQEPVMWLCVHDDRRSDRAITTPSPSRRDILNADGYEITPLYASPLAPEGGKN
ncbi:hypothetical protein [Pseudochrobactrum saccharolyticum]|uniref:Uncharacterized protein n=1 Tax=Pseudochrobactrum saccharolyticum TaxID=354352 RepID=A0A7W8AJ40_9HYPH|nr:hypothetical protein [Pseudochrobactrum saccharolyticum]KAB0538085.1 hypothetical protein F7P81_10170 [Pseudochrobactrum saccharolyticum]MBB5091311.1 hypothetical protein [Pseudochrobactrum saccharolyticum]MDP8250774.1 hypothetical protein [Pseudochrobactrum saccharolyticum]MDP8250801.1 hypothetical protein [Pseudochrobactrum saccharolyticum]